MSDTATQDCLAVQRVVQRTAALLDAEDLTGWLQLFDAAGTYEIRAHSTELDRTMSWWKSDVADLTRTLGEVPRHVRDPARRLRVLSPALVVLNGGQAHADTPFCVYRTLPTGESSLFVVGRYRDVLCKGEAGEWRYLQHHVELDTRVWDAFTHLPI